MTYKFDMTGVRLDLALLVAFSEYDNTKAGGWVESTAPDPPELAILSGLNSPARFLTTSQLFPAKLTSEQILPLVEGWLDDVEWPSRNFESDVMYRKGCRVRGPSESYDELGVICFITPVWLEYHK